MKKSNFKFYVEEVLENEWMGNEVNDTREYGKTPLGQEFAFVISKAIWFSVRLIVDEGHRELEYVRDNCVHNKFVVIRKQFLTLQEAIFYVEREAKDLSEGNYWGNNSESPIRYRVRKLPKDVLENPDKYLQPGDHLQRALSFCPLLYHEGVYLGNGLVAHIGNEPEDGSGRKMGSVNKKLKAQARIDDIANFVTRRCQTITVVVHCFRQKEAHEICDDARFLVKKIYGNGEYDFFHNNCQHFAALCVFNRKWMSDGNRLQNKFNFLKPFAYDDG